MLAASGLAARAGPKPGGVLRIAAPPGWIAERLLAPGASHDCLTEIDSDGRLRGELAADWAAFEGGRSWTVTLRSGAQFHDGRPVTPDEVMAALRQHLRGALGPVRRISKAGVHGIRFFFRFALLIQY